MASSLPSTARLFLICVPLLLLLSASDLNKSEAQGTDQPIVPGLSWSFYDSSCPRLESIVRNQLERVFDDDAGQAAGLLRLHFHDCFVQGCDGSVLLDGSASGPSEKDAPPNLTLRPEAFRIIDDLRRRVHRRCGRIVSCADIAALAARDAVVLSGGPNYNVPLGRRDGLNFATSAETIANLPAPSSNTTTILSSLSTKNFDPTDVVALSGAHTVGISHCSSFDRRLYPTQDSTMDQTFANNLRRTCPTNNTDNTTFMDIRTPNTFDNRANCKSLPVLYNRVRPTTWTLQPCNVMPTVHFCCNLLPPVNFLTGFQSHASHVSSIGAKRSLITRHI